MTLSLVSAIRERITRNKSTGLILFGCAFAATTALLLYTRVKQGYLF